MTFSRWTFRNTVTNATYTIFRNPKDGGGLGIEHNYLYAETTAPDGDLIVMEGNDKPQTTEWTGYVRSAQEDYEMFQLAENRDPVEVTDDLGRKYTVIVDSYVPARKHSASHVWRHDFTMKVTLIKRYRPATP